jgi:hypothetical protein
LRSIAYQMAMSNAAVREKLARLCQDGSTFDMDDALTIWTKIFKKGIFQVCLGSINMDIHLITNYLGAHQIDSVLGS